MMCGKEFPVALAMIQPEPFPGSFRHDGMPFEEIVAVSLKEIEMIQANGFDGYIIQNRNDAPVRQQALPETVAYMTALAKECRRKYPDMIQGILVNWDGVASLAVAAAAGSDFIRVEHTYTGVEVGYLFSLIRMTSHCKISQLKMHRAILSHTDRQSRSMPMVTSL